MSKRDIAILGVVRIDGGGSRPAPQPRQAADEPDELSIMQANCGVCPDCLRR